MKNIRKKMVVWGVLLLVSFSSLAFADDSENDQSPNTSSERRNDSRWMGSYSMTNSGGARNEDNGNHYNSWSGSENEDNGRSMREGTGSSMSQDDRKWPKTGSGHLLLRQQDENTLNDRINGIPFVQRVEKLLQVLTRIDTLEASIQNTTSLTPDRKARLIALLEEVKAFIQDRIDAIIGAGTGTGNTVPPVISALNSSNISTTGATLSVMSNTSGTGYFVVLLNGSIAPSVAQIKLGLNASGNNAIFSESGAITAGTNQFAISQLIPNTTFVVYFVATDMSGNTIASPVSTSFITLASPDTAPPVMTGASLSWTTSTGTMFTINVNESGTGYFVVLPTNSATPSATQIKAGQDASGATASIKGLGATLSGTNTFPITGLSPSTAYIIFFTAEDTSGNLQPIPQILNVTTLP